MLTSTAVALTVHHPVLTAETSSDPGLDAWVLVVTAVGAAIAVWSAFSAKASAKHAKAANDTAQATMRIDFSGDYVISTSNNTDPPRRLHLNLRSDSANVWVHEMEIVVWNGVLARPGAPLDRSGLDEDKLDFHRDSTVGTPLKLSSIYTRDTLPCFLHQGEILAFECQISDDAMEGVVNTSIQCRVVYSFGREMEKRTRQALFYNSAIPNAGVIHVRTSPVAREGGTSSPPPGESLPPA